ncbi:MAG: hypothetical protein KC457_06435, partial [Myxococcales bacterium]|nr:hypothetical protein [Myxococcales bacterium]
MTANDPPAEPDDAALPSPALGLLSHGPDEVVDHRLYGLRDGLDGMRDLMDRLLGPEGCPWDRAQTLETLRPYLVEE